jgi:endo-1,4-beta-xylanase
LLIALLLSPATVLGLLDPKIKAKGKKYFGAAADPGTIGVATDVTILTSDYGAYTPENRWVLCGRLQPNCSLITESV